MSLSDLGNLALVAQAVFLVISVWLIYSEIRENTRMVKASNVQSLVKISFPLTLELIHNPETASLWIRGPREFAVFSKVDQLRYQQLLECWLVLYENIFYQWRNGYLDYHSFKPWERHMTDFLVTHKANIQWARMSEFYEVEFVEYIKTVSSGHPSD
jgi:hypothetical protein